MSASLGAVRKAAYDQCITGLKTAGFMMQGTTGTDFILDKSQYVIAVRGDAALAGLRIGDKVLKIYGFAIALPEGRRAYLEHLYSKTPGDSITILIERDQLELTMRLPKFE